MSSTMKNEHAHPRRKEETQMEFVQGRHAAKKQPPRFTESFTVGFTAGFSEGFTEGFTA